MKRISLNSKKQFKDLSEADQKSLFFSSNILYGTIPENMIIIIRLLCVHFRLCCNLIVLQMATSFSKKIIFILYINFGHRAR